MSDRTLYTQFTGGWCDNCRIAATTKACPDCGQPMRSARITVEPADVDTPQPRPAPVGSWWRQPDGSIAQVDGDYLDGPGDQIVTFTLYRPGGSTGHGKWGGKELAAAYTRIEADEVPDWVEVAW